MTTPTNDRLLPQILRELCDEHGIHLQFFSEDWIARMERDGQAHWSIGYTFDLNSASSDMIARDKVAAYNALKLASLPAIEHYLAKSRIEPVVNESRLGSLPDGAPCVIKPLLGSGGKTISFHTSLREAIDSINASSELEWAISPWYDLVSERRVILLDGNLLLSYTKTDPVHKNGLKYFNLAHGSVPHISGTSEEEIVLAQQAVRACGLRLAAVDIVTMKDGSQRIMEVNSGISLEYFVQHSAWNYQIARYLYKNILEAVFA